MNKEFLYMQKLAGLITESEYKAKLNENSPSFKIDDDIKAYWEDKDFEKIKQVVVDKAMGVIKHVADMFGTDNADKLYSYIEQAKNSSSDDELGKAVDKIYDFLYLNTDVGSDAFPIGKINPKNPNYGEKEDY